MSLNSIAAFFILTGLIFCQSSLACCAGGADPIAMAEASEFVFLGTVRPSDDYQDVDGWPVPIPVAEVEVLEVLKGEWREPTVTLASNVFFSCSTALRRGQTHIFFLRKPLIDGVFNLACCSEMWDWRRPDLMTEEYEKSRDRFDNALDSLRERYGRRSSQ